MAGGLALLAAAGAVQGAERAVLRLGGVEGEGYALRDVELELTPGAARARLRIGALELPGALAHWRTAQLDCEPVSLGSAAVDCPRGRLEIGLDRAPAVAMAGDLKLRRQAGGFELRGEGLRLGGGRIDLMLFVRDADWSFEATASDVAAQVLGALLGELAGGVRLTGGSLGLEASGRRRGAGVQVTARARLRALQFADADARLAGEGLDVDLRLDVDGDPRRPGLGASATIATGILGLDPIFVEATATRPLRLSGKGRLLRGAAASTLELDSLSLEHAGVLRAEGSARLGPDAATPAQVALTLRSLDAQAFYETYVQPAAYGTALAAMEVSGRLSATLRSGPAGLRAELELQDANLRDSEARFEVRALDTRIGVDTSGARMPLEVGWKGAQILRLDLGAGRLRGHSAGDRLRSDAPLRVPLLDGVLQVDGLTVSGLLRGPLGWRFSGLLEPLSMERLSAALDWPPLGGTLSGVLPEAIYADDRLQLRGALQARVFDGSVVLHRLALERPFGVAPRLETDADVRGLSLEALTGAFSFGTIQGRLDGEVRGLVLENWQPSAFDARFATVAGSGTPQRLSQRAVRNLSSLGGAGIGALSQGFLGIFKDFSYARLGLACRLRDGVCEMNGVAPAPNGYYIVQGAGLPRIDVIGYIRRVDWQVLVQRLQQAAASGGPVIE